jgi:hypothetical protein
MVLMIVSTTRHKYSSKNKFFTFSKFFLFSQVFFILENFDASESVAKGFLE